MLSKKARSRFIVLILLLVPAIYYIREDIVAYFKHPFSDSQAEENS